MGRRELLAIAGASLASAFVPRALFAQDRTRVAIRRPALVVIFLRGGQDALNVVVPHGDARYREIRPQIAIPPKDAAGGVVPLDGTFGLHPALAALKPLWESKKLAPIVCTGSPHETRSHFDAQDFMERAAPGLRSVKDGWLNRFLEATKKKEARADDEVLLRAVALQPLLPRSLRGAYPVLAVPDAHVLERDRVLDAMDKVYGDGCKEPARADGDPVVAAGQDTVEALKRWKELVARPAGAAGEYPKGRLGAKLRDLAALIGADAGLEVACVDWNGWDHHANEGGGTGTIATMLEELGGALAAFARDLGPRLDRTLVLVMTEFGRTCRENGTGGTDHGHGSAMLLLGGAVKGGKVHGKWSGLAEKELYQGRDLPVTTDFRDVFSTVLAHHMAFEAPRSFFPEYTPSAVKGLF